MKINYACRRFGRHPYRPSYFKLLKLDLVRIIIASALDLGDWEIDALRELVNTFLNEQYDAPPVSLNSLRMILYYNCEGYWAFDGKIIRKEKDAESWSSLRPDHRESRAFQIGISVALNAVIERGGAMRLDGAGEFCHPGIADKQSNRAARRYLHRSKAPKVFQLLATAHALSA